MSESTWWKITYGGTVAVVHAVWGVIHQVNGPAEWAMEHDIAEVREVVKRLGGTMVEIPD